MRTHTLLHKLLTQALPHIHRCRLKALANAVEALLFGKSLSLTLLGRAMRGRAKERHCIRKMDRLLGNQHLHGEIDDYYHAINQLIAAKLKQPIISVDWSCANKRKDYHILRASLTLKGRGLTLYQQLYPKKQYNSHKAHVNFLNQLKQCLPAQCRPIIVTDAGFLCPWFKHLDKLGFDWVGRIRHNIQYYKHADSLWSSALALYRRASSKACALVNIRLSKTHQLPCSLVVYKSIKRGRHALNRSGKKTNNTQSKRASKRRKDPWLLVTSLDVKQRGAAAIVAIYKKRMQIEEDFRDTKSHQYGFGLRYSRSRCPKRLAVLLLIAALASLLCWIIAMAAKQENRQRDFQANSVRHYTVLSAIYLACQLVRRHQYFHYKKLKSALIKLQLFAQECQICS